MMRSLSRGSIPLVFLWSALWLPGQQPEDFAHRIAPIIGEHCAECHTGDKRKGGLSMNTRDLLLEGSEYGEVVVPGNSGVSELMDAITTGEEDFRMPPKGDRLTREQVETIRNWIDEGLDWPTEFVFGHPNWQPPLKPRRPLLPTARDGRNHPIDRLVDHYFGEEGLERPEPIAEAVFARRLHLDLLGLLPETEVLRRHLRHPDRARLVKEVLANDVAYTDHWLSFWNDLLRNDYTGTGFIDYGRTQITAWLYQALLTNKPFDEFTRELIDPDNPSAGFINGIQWRGNVNASQTRNIQFSQNISQVFLGINMKCASCHDSFVDDWKLEEAYNLGAIFAEEPLELHRCDKPTGRIAQAAWIFPELGNIDPGAPKPERLKQLAGLMTHPENGRFTRTIVNRIWHRLMGRGIVHPVDAMDSPPWSEDLLDYLAVYFSDTNYDIKQLMEHITTSRAYQSKSATTEEPSENMEYKYRGPVAKRMTAEQFVDAVWQLTGTAPAGSFSPVLRKPVVKEHRAKVPVNGQWIWHDTQNTTSPARLTLRKTFEVKGGVSLADLVISCSHEYKLWVNGERIASDLHRETVEVAGLKPLLKAGENEILLSLNRLNLDAGVSGLFVEGRILAEANPGRMETIIASDESWSWTRQTPNNEGIFNTTPADWKPVQLHRSELKSRTADQIYTALEYIRSETRPPVRAALMDSDLLMRSLGRPNREQVVSVRPETLSTLQAIDLSNGEILAETIQQGAGLLQKQDWRDKEQLVGDFFNRALSRQPTRSEQSLLTALVGNTSGAAGIEDFIWTVCMLPEFQIIR